MKTLLHLIVLPFGLAMSTIMVHGEDYTYTTNNGTITITEYTGSGGAVTIPEHDQWPAGHQHRGRCVLLAAPA